MKSHNQPASLSARRRSVIATVATILLTAPLAANIGAPVTLSLDSADALQAGQPITVIATLQPESDLPHASFELAHSISWQILDGVTRFDGGLRSGQNVELRFRAVPLSGQPEALVGVLTVPGYPGRKIALDGNRLGGHFPEQGKSTEMPSTRAAAVPALEFEPGVALPEPLPPTLPRTPGQAPPLPPPSPKAGAGADRAVSVVSVATGRFVYADDNGVLHGVRNATVQLLDRNPILDTLCASGVTDSTGNFMLNGLCGDFSDGPDLYVRIGLNNSVTEVRPASLLAGSYTFETQPVNNFPGGTLSLGTITITQNQGAFHVHNVVMRSHAYMQNYGENLPKVTMIWPSVGSFYTAPGAISLEQAVPFSDEGVVVHEFGHHVLWSLAESPIPNYSNGICDNPPFAGHCLYSPEQGVVSWTEGWPNFLAAAVHNAHADAEQWGPTMLRFETRGDTSEYAGQEDRIEGVIAAILWDLIDTPSDDQFETGSGRRDNVDLTFAIIWDVIRNYDPSTSLLHNHPTSIHELWEGLRQTQPNSINRIAEAYREHNIDKPLPDMVVTSTGTAPSRISRGGSLALANTIRNIGQDRANSGSTAEFSLVRKAGFPTKVALGTRSLAANMNAGASNAATTSLTIPMTTPVGAWLLMVCSDATDSVPESNEANNCLAAGTVEVQ